MKKILLLLVAVSYMYSKPYIYDYSCDSLYDDYKDSYENISSVNFSSYDYYCKKLGVKRDRIEFSSPEEEARANEEYLRHQQLTLGVACEQVIKKIPVYYKKDYCQLLQSNSAEKVQKTTQLDTPKVVPKQVVEPAVRYKNTPQLKVNELHIYNVTDVKYFRNKTDVVMIESSTGSFAIPISEIVNAERINFTPTLSQKIDAIVNKP
jgi:hypothetical protein